VEFRLPEPATSLGHSSRLSEKAIRAGGPMHVGYLNPPDSLSDSPSFKSTVKFCAWWGCKAEQQQQMKPRERRLWSQIFIAWHKPTWKRLDLCRTKAIGLLPNCDTIGKDASIKFTRIAVQLPREFATHNLAKTGDSDLKCLLQGPHQVALRCAK